MLDKPAAIAVLPGKMAKQVFPSSERAGQVEHFNGNPPGHSGQVQPDDRPPLEGKQASKQHKQDEREVKQHQAVGS